MCAGILSESSLSDRKDIPPTSVLGASTTTQASPLLREDLATERHLEGPTVARRGLNDSLARRYCTKGGERRVDSDGELKIMARVFEVDRNEKPAPALADRCSTSSPEARKSFGSPNCREYSERGQPRPSPRMLLNPDSFASRPITTTLSSGLHLQLFWVTAIDSLLSVIHLECYSGQLVDIRNFWDLQCRACQFCPPHKCLARGRRIIQLFEQLYTLITVFVTIQVQSAEKHCLQVRVPHGVAPTPKTFDAYIQIDFQTVCTPFSETVIHGTGRISAGGTAFENFYAKFASVIFS
ncbi:hypothetical protein DFH11DRAFT_1746973 [Phellopilus nigrolimitatus]|nr:hypothetical protein DFH11DRAFT_1746973 [Phellopilus nigrolimitatus]